MSDVLILAGGLPAESTVLVSADQRSIIGDGTAQQPLRAGSATFDNFVFRPGGTDIDNVFTVWSDLVAALSTRQGFKTIQFDDSLSTPCVIPAGSWDMSQVIWTGMLHEQAAPAAIRNAVSISDGASFPNLRYIGGFISITNHNSTTAPVVITPTGSGQVAIFNCGGGQAPDNPIITNSGAAPFWDCSALVAGEGFFIRGNCQIGGTSPAIQMGNSPARIGFDLNVSTRIRSGMVAGINPAATLAVNMGTSPFARQDDFAGTILRGEGNSDYNVVAPAVGAEPYLRLLMFPAPQNQQAAAPSTVALVAATGLGMNTVLRLDATAGAIAQVLPLIRASEPPIGSTTGVAGVLNSEGLIVIVKEFSGMNPVNVTPAPSETLEGDTEPVVVPAGGARIFLSDGISDWRVIGGYL